MSDSSDRTHGPFLAILFIAFVIVAIVFFGPQLEQFAAQTFSGNRGGGFSINGWDPFGSIISAVEAFGRAVGRLLGR